MISYWGVDHGSEVSKADKKPGDTSLAGGLAATAGGGVAGSVAGTHIGAKRAGYGGISDFGNKVTNITASDRMANPHLYAGTSRQLQRARTQKIVPGLQKINRAANLGVATGLAGGALAYGGYKAARRKNR